MVPIAARRRLEPRTLLLILTGLNLFNYLDRFVVAAVLPQVQQDLGISDTYAGWLQTAFMIGYFVTSPFFGWLGDRFPRRYLIAAGIFVWSVGTVLSGFAPTFASMMAFRVMVGLGEASYATISPSLISDSYPPGKRNSALTIFYIAIPCGTALGYILGGYVAAHWGWQHAFLWAGAPGLLLALILLPFEEPARGGAEGRTEDAARKPTLRELGSLFHTWDFVLVVLGYTAYTFALGAFAFWGPSFLHRVHGMAMEDADKFFGVVAVIAGLVSTVTGGFLATAWHRRNPAAYSWMLCLAVLVAVPAAFGTFLAGSAFWSMTLLAVAMLFLFLPTGPVNTLILETVPINLRASAMAVSIFMIHMFGDLWSPGIVGWVTETTGSLRTGVLILPSALLVSGVFGLALALRQQRRAHLR